MLYAMLFNPADGNVLCVARNIVERGLIAYPFDMNQMIISYISRAYFKVRNHIVS